MTDILAAVIEATVQELASTRFNFAAPAITRETDLRTDLRCDQLDIVCISLDLDERLSIDVPEAALEQVQTIGDLADLYAAARRREDA